MEQNDHIAYKTWVENLQEPAPEGAWDAIADQLDIDAAWDNISETLDLDAVWQNIDAGLPQAVPVSTPSASLRFPKLFWAAAALVLLTLTTPITEEVSEQKTDFQHEETTASVSAKPELKVSESNRSEVNRKVAAGERNVQKHNLKSSTDNSVVKQSENKSGNPVQVTETFANVPLQRIDSAQTKQFVEQEMVSDYQDKYVPVQPDSIVVPVLKQNPDSIQRVAATQSVKDSVEKNDPERAKWQVGVIGSVKNTWLINPETTDGLKRSSLNATRVTFGKEFGLTLQRSIGGSSAVQFEYYFYSEIGQR